MTEITSNSHHSSNLHDSPVPAAAARCSQRTQQGRRCRMPVSDPISGLCGRHSQVRQQHLDSADLSGDLLGDMRELQSAGEVGDFLSGLLVLLAQGRISIRRAAVLCYIAGQLLRTFREIERTPISPISLVNPEWAAARRPADLLNPPAAVPA